MAIGLNTMSASCTFVAGIIVQSVRPGFVATNMSGIKRGSLFTPLPEVFVRSAMGTIGVESPTYGYWSHWVMVSLMQFGMSISEDRFLRFVRGKMEHVKDRFLKRKSRKSE